MQARRPALWIGSFAVATLTALILLSTPTLRHDSQRASVMSAFTAIATLVMLFMPIAAGFLMSDRLTRDRKTRVDELLETAPALPGMRLMGKYLGAVVATVIPTLLFYVIGVGYLLALRGRDFAALPLALVPFVAVILPGMLFVAAFSLACPLVIWGPLYQFLFLGYWFWGNLVYLPPLPTLNGTLLTADGDYAAIGYFGSDSGVVTHATPLQATASIALLLIVSALALLAAWAYQRWRLARQ
jgi:ABC-type transport system involved in multi-copper enzyme maturation permease subunit